MLGRFHPEPSTLWSGSIVQHAWLQQSAQLSFEFVRLACDDAKAGSLVRKDRALYSMHGCLNPKNSCCRVLFVSLSVHPEAPKLEAPGLHCTTCTVASIR